MQRVLFFLPLLLLQLSTFAQFKVLGEGNVFDEPEKGNAKIIQLKNGYTIFCLVQIKDGIDLKIYDAKHKFKTEKHLEPAYGKLRGGGIDGIFEINGDLVLLISEVDEKTPVLYRLIIDAANGNLKKEEKIASLTRGGFGAGYAIAFGGLANPDFFVRKDPYSDNYSVALFNTLESDRNKRIEIVHYGADHKEISRGYYGSPDDKYKYLQYIDMTVIGSEKVCIMAFAYNTKSRGVKESVLLMAGLDKGNKEVKVTEFDFTKDLIISNGITRYNPYTKKVVMLTSVKSNEKKGNYYSLNLAYLDPFNNTISKAVDPYPEKASRKSVEIFGRKNEFAGMPQNLYINSDGTFTIVYEEISTVAYKSVIDTYLGNIAVSTFSKEGEEMSTYFIPKKHNLTNTYLTPFYLSQREGTAQLLQKGNQFKSFAYLNGNAKSYVLFNDVEKNTENLERGKQTMITGVSDCDGFSYKLEGNKVMPDRTFVFGKPDEKRDHNLGLFAISDYDAASNTYVTLQLEKDGRQKGVKLVWLQP